MMNVKNSIGTMQNISCRIMLFLLLAVAGGVPFYHFADTILPIKAARFELNRSQAVDIARNFVEKQGFLSKNYRVAAIATDNNHLFHYLQKNLGYDQTVDLMQEEMPEIFAIRWEVYWYQNVPRNAPQERFFVYVTDQGKIVGFNHLLPSDTTLCPPAKSRLTQQEALTLALDFLNQTGVNIDRFEKLSSSSHSYEKRTDHTFRWKRDFERLKGHVDITVRIQGNRVGQFSQGFILPQDVMLKLQHYDSDRFSANIYSIIFLLLIFLLPISVFLRKYHAGEISIKTAKVFFFILWIAMFIKGVLSFKVMANAWALGELSYDEIAMVKLLFYTLIIYPFLASSAFMSWSVGESLAREKFGEKLAALDAIINRQFSTKKFALSALRGYAYGFVALGLTGLATWSLLNIFNGTLQLDSYRHTISLFLPFLVPVLSALIASLLSELLFRLFANLYFFKILKYKFLAIIFSSVIFSLSSLVIWNIQLAITPYYLYLIIAFINGLLFGYLFWRYDLVTVLFADFILVGILYTIPVLSNPNFLLQLQGIFSLLLLFSPGIIIVRGLLVQKVFTYKPETMPEHIKRISERERMARELEIARQVQMKLLPKEDPDFEESDIAGFCIPAEKVGGDYYDFITLNEKCIGLVIGDVSGKGVPASIYMTLTKGVFQSYSEEKSPRNLLIKVNSLLYKTIERGTFISLFYAILNVKSKQLVYARGGHNPVIYYNSRADTCKLLESSGMALGLDAGEIFNQLLQEEKMQLYQGDLLVFYTDGFIEAMNHERCEYSEEKLINIVYNNRHKGSKEMINTIYTDVKKYIKNYPHYDDMTMIVVKIH